MGVDGLTKYARDCGLYRVVDLQEVANDFRKKNVGEPVIAVDGSQSAWYLYRNMDPLRGGQYKEFRESCEHFVRRFRDMGIRLAFFFDGLPVEEKIKTWLKRRADKAKEIGKLFAKLRAVQSEGNGNVGCRLLPEAVVPCATVAFKQLGCQTQMSTTDCDTELASFAAGNKCCVAVLSNDADFLIYGGVPCLVTFSNLKMGQKVTGWCFRSVDLASNLGIKVEDLPTLASFVGNDIVKRDVLQAPHRTLRKLYGYKEVIELVAEMLKKTPRGDLKKMCQVAFGIDWERGLKLVQESVRSYSFELVEAVTAPKSSAWDKVLRHVEARHVACEIPGYVYTVMKCCLMRAGDVLEDLSNAQSDSPPTGLVVREMLSRMYTVLLWDSGRGPFRVTEYIPVEPGKVLEETVEVQKSLPEGVHHPGILALWSGPEDRRWRLFSWVVSPKRDLTGLRSLTPKALAVPAAALTYLYHEASVLTKDEVRILAMVAVSVDSFSARQLSNLHVKLPSERAIYVATLFVRTALHVLDVAAACGLSFPRPADCHLDAYFDGKLFHHIYSQSRHSDLKAAAGWDESQEYIFNRFMNAIE